MSDKDDDLQSPADAPASADVVETSDEDLWNEMEGEDAASTPDEDDQDGDDAADEDDAPDPDEDEDKPAAKSGKDDDPAQKAKDAEEPDLETLRTRNAEMEQKYRSEQSRAIGQQRRADRLQKQLEDLKAAQAKRKDQDTDAHREREQKLESVSEEYGDVVGPLVDTLKDLRSRADELDARDAARLEEAQQEYNDLVRAEKAVLTETHSDGLKVVIDNNDLFNRWIEDQPKMYRDIRDRNADDILDGHGAALLISRFKQALAEAQSGSPDEPDTSSPSTRRQQQRDGARTTRQKSRQPVVSDLPANEDDPQAIWDEFDRKERAATR